ncbi:MAG: AraC family transcriptional regulator [Clostridiales bacterium]|nr:AraC family transcriptional regulator [Clostridiales bacterium]
MDWLNQLQIAIDYIEDNICEEITVESIAKSASSSVYHFQRIFSLTFGVTVGEYVRLRRLTLAGEEIKSGKKITEIAFKYGYNSIESFTRAFKKFFGVVPSKTKGVVLKSFPKLSASFNYDCANELKYIIEEREGKTLVGYKKRFKGCPYGEERAKQEEDFFRTTRAKQWLLIGASCDYHTDYCIIKNVDEKGYDFYVAWELDEWTRSVLYDKKVTGVDFIEKMGFEEIVLPQSTYAVFQTPKKKRPIIDYVKIRNRIAQDNVGFSNYVFSCAPEVTVMHWRPKREWSKERFIEICLPVEKID